MDQRPSTGRQESSLLTSLGTTGFCSQGPTGTGTHWAGGAGDYKRRASWCLWRSGAQEAQLVPAGCCLPPNLPFTVSLHFSTGQVLPLHSHLSCERRLSQNASGWPLKHSLPVTRTSRARQQQELSLTRILVLCTVSAWNRPEHLSLELDQNK